MLESQKIVNLIFDDKAPDFDDFKNVLIVSDVDDKRLANLIKRAKLDRIRFANFDEIERAGDFAALFTNLEEGDTLICRFNSFVSRSIEELTKQILTDRTFDLVIEQEDGDRVVNIKGAHSTIIFLQNEYVSLPLGFTNLFQLKTILGDGIINESETHYDDDDDDEDRDNTVSNVKYTYKPIEKKSIFEIQGLEKDGQYLYVETCYRMGEVILAEELSDEEMNEDEIIFNDFEDASYFDVVDTEYDFDGDEDELENIKNAWQENGLSGLEDIGWDARTLSIKIIGGLIAIRDSQLQDKVATTSSDMETIKLYATIDGFRASDEPASIDHLPEEIKEARLLWQASAHKNYDAIVEKLTPFMSALFLPTNINNWEDIVVDSDGNGCPEIRAVKTRIVGIDWGRSVLPICKVEGIFEIPINQVCSIEFLESWQQENSNFTDGIVFMWDIDRNEQTEDLDLTCGSHSGLECTIVNRDPF